jgi:hypothetical protein
MKYIAKPDTWFDGGSEAILIDDYGHELPFGLFEGWRTCDNPLSENRKLGEKYRDQEDCGFDEFE